MTLFSKIIFLNLLPAWPLTIGVVVGLMIIALDIKMLELSETSKMF